MFFFLISDSDFTHNQPLYSSTDEFWALRLGPWQQTWGRQSQSSRKFVCRGVVGQLVWKSEASYEIHLTCQRCYILLLQSLIVQELPLTIFSMQIFAFSAFWEMQSKEGSWKYPGSRYPKKTPRCSAQWSHNCTTVFFRSASQWWRGAEGSLPRGGNGPLQPLDRS